MADTLEPVGPRSGSAPLVYTLTDTADVDLASVFAHFNGAAAGGSFRPTVTIKAQNGTILARLFPSDTLAVGDSADVTFAPFLREGGSSGELETTDGVIDVLPTGVLEIGDGLVLTNPVSGTAHIAVAGFGVDYDAIVLGLGSMVAYWKADDASGNLVDSSGAAIPKDLVLSSGTTAGTYQVPGAPLVVGNGGAWRSNYNQAVNNAPGGAADEFSATDAVVTPRWAFANVSFSVSLWIKPTSGWSLPVAVDSAVLIGTQQGGPPSTGWGVSLLNSNHGFGSGLGPVPTFFRGVGAGDQLITGVPAIPFDQWTHVCCTYDTATMRMFFNGVIVGSLASVGAVASYQQIFAVGGTFWAGLHTYYYGAIDEIALFSRALSAYEIARLAGL